MAIYFPNVPATFIHIPKTGGTSFQIWANDNIAGCIIERFPLTHSTLSYAQNKCKDIGTTIAFVRNPYARLVSMFFYAGQRAEERIHNRKNKISITAHTSIEEDFAALALYRKGFDRWAESHTEHMSQLAWLGGQPADLTIKIEEIDREFYRVQDLLNCNVPLPHLNSSQHSHYREYYTPSTVKLVGKLFKDDLNAFNYEF